jgi:hypothetical protein
VLGPDRSEPHGWPGLALVSAHGDEVLFQTNGGLDGTGPNRNRWYVRNASRVEPTTGLTASATTQQYGGTSARLTITTPPDVPGTVQLFDGDQPLGQPARPVAGSLVRELPRELPRGVHRLHAELAPDDGSAWNIGVSPTVDVTVRTAATTNVTLTAPSQGTYGQPVPVTAVATPASAGSLQLLVDGTPTGAPVATADGTARLALPRGLTAGRHQVAAAFTPQDPTRFGSAAAPAAYVTVLAHGHVALRLPDRDVAPNVKVRSRVTIAAPGGLAVSGVVDIYDGRRLVVSRSVTVNGSLDITVRLPRLGVGIHRITVRLSGELISPATSKPRVLRVH